MTADAAQEPRIRRWLPKSGFARNVALLAGGTAFGQLVTVLMAPVLTRLFTPAELGVLAVYSSTIGVLGAMASLQYQQAALLPEDDTAAAGLVIVALLGSAASSALIAGIAALYGKRIALGMGAAGLAPHVWLVPLGVLAIAVYETWTHWSMRKKRFGAIAKTRLAQSLTQTGVQLATGIGRIGAVGLLAGQLLGQIVGTTSLARVAWRQERNAFRSVRLRSMLDQAKRYRRFPIYSTSSVLFAGLSGEAPVFLLAYFFGETVTGLYAISHRMLSMPVNLIAKSTSQVLFSEAPARRREGRLAELTLSLFTTLARLSLPPAVLLVLTAPELFAVVFGERWRAGGLFAQWIAPWLLLVFLAMPFMPIAAVLERQAGTMVFQALLLSVRVATLVAGGMSRDATLTVAMFSSAGAAAWFGYLVWTFSITGVRAADWLRVLISEALLAAVLGLPVLATKLLHVSSMATLGASALSAAVFLALAYKRRRLPMAREREVMG